MAESNTRSTLKLCAAECILSCQQLCCRNRTPSHSEASIRGRPLAAGRRCSGLAGYVFDIVYEIGEGLIEVLVAIALQHCNL